MNSTSDSIIWLTKTAIKKEFGFNVPGAIILYLHTFYAHHIFHITHEIFSYFMLTGVVSHDVYFIPMCAVDEPGNTSQ